MFCMRLFGWLALLPLLVTGAQFSFADELLPGVKVRHAPFVVTGPNGERIEVTPEITTIRVPREHLTEKNLKALKTLLGESLETAKDLAPASMPTSLPKEELLIITGDPDPKSKSELFKLSGVSGSLGWENAVGLKDFSGLSQRRQEKWSEHVTLAANYAEPGAEVFLGVLPESTRAQDFTFTIMRFVTILGVIYKATVVSDHASDFQALAMGLTSSSMSAFFMFFHPQMVLWYVKERLVSRGLQAAGNLLGKKFYAEKWEKMEKPRAFVKNASNQVQYFWQEYKLSVAYYGLCELLRGVIGLRSNILKQFFTESPLAAMKEFAKGPMLSSVKGLLSEGVAIVAISKLTKDLQDRNPDLKSEIILGSKVWALALSAVATSGVVMDLMGAPVSNVILIGVAVVHGSILGLSFWQPGFRWFERHAIRGSLLLQDSWESLATRSRSLAERLSELRSDARSLVRRMTVSSTGSLCRDFFAIN